MAIYTVPGPARRRCTCGVYLHVRVNVCPACGADKRTLSEPPAAVHEEESPAVHETVGLRQVRIPAGSCPVDLPRSISDRAVRSWVGKVQEAFAADGKFILPEGLAYFVESQTPDNISQEDCTSMVDAIYRLHNVEQE